MTSFVISLLNLVFFRRAYATFGDIFGIAIGIQGLFCVFLFCFVAFCLLLSEEFVASIPGLALLGLMQLFIPCHLINELEVLTGNFCYNIYESDWIGDERHRLHDLRILMETTKKPIVMKVAHLFTLNLKTFLDVRSLQLSQIVLINYKKLITGRQLGLRCLYTRHSFQAVKTSRKICPSLTCVSES